MQGTPKIIYENGTGMIGEIRSSIDYVLWREYNTYGNTLVLNVSRFGGIDKAGSLAQQCD